LDFKTSTIKTKMNTKSLSKTSTKNKKGEDFIDTDDELRIFLKYVFIRMMIDFIYEKRKIKIDNTIDEKNFK